MHNPVEQLLADLGIPVSCCPTCQICNWEFHGAVDTGIYTVTCRTCGRRYEMMTVPEELSHIARMFASHCDRCEVETANVWYSRLVTTWNNRSTAPLSERRAVVTRDGESPRDTDDDWPF